MTFSRIALIVAAGCCWLRPAPLIGQEAPFRTSRQYSATIFIFPARGSMMSQKIFSENGKVRTEMNVQGVPTIMIVRPDLHKFYQVVTSQKMVLEMSYDPSKFNDSPAAGPQGKFELMGQETAGLPCLKYKVTSSKDHKVFFFWINTATKAPVKMESDDNSLTILWRDYKEGPQDPSLFEPPADYRVTAMPLPGGTGG